MPDHLTDSAISEQSGYSSIQICVTGLCCFSVGALYGWSALIPAVEALFTRSTQLAGLIFSTAIVAFTVSVLLVPRLPRVCRELQGCALFSVSGAVAVIAASMAENYAGFVASFSLGFGAASGAVYINALSVAAASTRPQLTTPIMVACFGLGGVVFGPLWQLLTAKGWGLDALRPLSLALIISALLAAMTTSKRWYRTRAKPTYLNSSSKVQNTRPLRQSNTVPYANQQVLMILVWLTFALGSMGGLMILGLAAKIIDTAGGGAAVASFTLIGVAVGNTTGRLSVSLYTMILTPARVSIIAIVIVGCGLAITLHSSIACGVSAGLVLTATGYGTLASAIPTLTRTVFSEDQFSVRFSIIFTAWGTAGLTAPWVAGFLFDITGNFQLAITAALVATGLATITALLSHRIHQTSVDTR